MFAAIAADRDNRVVVITGTGSPYRVTGGPGVEGAATGQTTATNWDRTIWEGNRLVNQLLDVRCL